ncbi:discoidin domain-containing protein [Nakamurella leprariae]|uniref:Discoidin domain-containing protein n=1 Tax=Nakamurella leprariae TaxID=2803911 RepID=A0A939C3W9_9ACTN|nr:discoidin domain-containing protein [Nakamurella leprariae]MBM9469497.1 discoidin domain-containing protein [Nakamurella leprariae]
MSVPCPVCSRPTSDGTVCLHCGAINAPTSPPAGGATPAPDPTGDPGPDGPITEPVPVVGGASGAVPAAAWTTAPAEPGAADAGPTDAEVRADPDPDVRDEDATTVLPATAGIGGPGVVVGAPPTVTPPPATPPIATPPPGTVPDPARRRRRATATAVALGALAALIIAGAWLGGYWFGGRDDSGSSTLADRSTTADVAAGSGGTSTVPPPDRPPNDPGDDSFPTDDDGSSDTALPTLPFDPVPVDGTATCTAPQGMDSAGVPQTYDPANAFDGLPDTAWRCQGDGVGQTLTVDFGAPVTLTEVGIIPGYDKIDEVDGSDRFVQGRTVLRVQWEFDDGTVVEATPAGQRDLQWTPVSTTTSTARMTVLETAPGRTITDDTGAQWAAVDTMAVSEVAFRGLE